MTDRSGDAVADVDGPGGIDVSVAVRQRSRDEAWTLATTVPCLVAGIVLLDFDPAGWSWTVWACVAALAFLGIAAVRALLFSAPGRRRQEERYVAEYAVLHHRDPEPGRHGEADRRARAMTAQSVIGLVVSFFALMQVWRAYLSEPAELGRLAAGAGGSGSPGPGRGTAGARRAPVVGRPAGPAPRLTRDAAMWENAHVR